ncbi:MAG: hypothetical protein GYB68_06890, partial [Chloroflexi bacterium]|nr:hypothetical protein [Chloroflexota bacterium]
MIHASYLTPFTDNDLNRHQTLASRERGLLMLASLFVILNRVILLLVRDEPLWMLWPLPIWVLVAVAMHMALNRTVPLRDPYILPLVLLLCGWGLTLVERLAPAFGPRQVIWVVVGAFAAIMVTLLPPHLRLLRRYRYSWLLVGLALLAATLLFGVNPSGFAGAPQLWLGLQG